MVASSSGEAIGGACWAVAAPLQASNRALARMLFMILQLFMVAVNSAMKSLVADAVSNLQKLWRNQGTIGVVVSPAHLRCYGVLRHPSD
jgi:orotidine-5'-phosphate decarboxylase